MYSIPMAMTDYLPVVFFLVGSLFLQKDLYNKMSKGAYALFCAGTLDVFLSGFAKATYKLLYAAEICDFTALNNMFFPVQTIGFVLAGTAMICLLTRKQGKGRIYAATPVFFSGTMLFVSGMILGLAGLDGGLMVISKRLKKNSAVFLFVISFVFCLMMGYLSSKDFTQSYMNWAAEAVNLVGQGAFMIGSFILHKAGLENIQFEN